MNSIKSVPIRVLVTLGFLQDCESVYPSLLPGLQLSLGSPWFLFQPLTCAPWHCTLSGCPVERTMASDKMQVISLNEHYSFLSGTFRGSSLHFSHWAAKRNCRAWADILKIKTLRCILPRWVRHVNSSQGDSWERSFVNTLQWPLGPNLKYFCSILYQHLLFCLWTKPMASIQ